MPRPRSRYTPAANRFLRTTGKIADKSFNAMARQNQGVAGHCQASYDLWSSVQDLNLSCASVRFHCRAVDRIYQKSQYYQAHGEYPSIVVRAWWWFRDVMLLYPLDLLWAYLQPILLYLFFLLVTALLIIVANVIFFGGIYLLLTA